MTERLLITKLVRDGDHAALFAKGHQYKDLTLFDLSDLADVGIDYAALENGVEVPCRFWAIYELSEKLNKKGNAYKDVIALEAIDKPATTTSAAVGDPEVLAELRAIRALLQTWLESEDMHLPTRPAPELAYADQDPNGNGNGHDEPPAQPEPATEATTGPMGATRLLSELQADGYSFTSVGHLLYGIRKQIGDQRWGWPVTTDTEGWAIALRYAREYGKTL